MEYVIKNQNHEIVGIDRGETCAFLGMRYATAKRFEKPVLEPLKDKVVATRYGDACPQWRQFFDESKSKSKQDIFYYKEFREGLRFTYSEDCLNVNVYAPKDKTNLPVLVYIHGGAFTICSSDEKPFDGKTIAEQDVIFVTFNYRLNVFGYYSDETTSNLAFYDMKAAIEWVKQYISVFGGDPDNITLMGQSAGAISIQNLMLLPDVKKMVKGVIMLSGASPSGIFSPKSKKRAIRFFNSVKRDLAKRGMDIKTASYQDVFLAWNRLTKRNLFGLAKSMLSTMPVYDGKIVRKDLYKTIFSDEQVPCIIGVTKDDLLKNYLHGQANAYLKKSKNKVWVMRFYHDLPGDNAGAYHSGDLWYILGLWQHGWRKFDEKDEQIAKELSARYCAFCKNHDPNVDGYPEWKEHTSYTLK